MHAALLAASNPSFPAREAVESDAGQAHTGAGRQAAIRWVLSNLNDQNFCTLGCGAARFYSIQDERRVRWDKAECTWQAVFQALKSINFPN